MKSQNEISSIFSALHVLLLLFSLSATPQNLSLTCFSTPPSSRQDGGAVLAAERVSPLGCSVAPVPFSPCSWSYQSQMLRCSTTLCPPPLSLLGGWCPERRMTNASASSYWRIWTTWLQPRTVPTASTRCWLNGRGLAVDGPICVCIGKIWQGGVFVYLCVSVYSIGLCTWVCVCLFT